MPAYKGTKELPNAANKQNRMMFTSMQKDREAMAKGRPDSVQRAEKGEMNVLKDKPKAKKMAKGGATKAGKAMVKKSADTMGRAMVKKFAKGGLASGHTSANGIAKKGKTKGTMVKMCSGGKMKKGR